MFLCRKPIGLQVEGEESLLNLLNSDGFGCRHEGLLSKEDEMILPIYEY